MIQELGELFPRRIYWVKFGQYIGRHLIGLFCISLQSPVDSFKGLSPSLLSGTGNFSAH